jgi:hypothetical protein
MQSADEKTLLQTALKMCPVHEDPERAWAFLVFCGLVETRAHADFLRLASERSGQITALGDSLLDFVTRRAELVDPGSALAQKLWTYFQVGSSLEPEPQLGADMDEGTQPGIGPVVVES